MLTKFLRVNQVAVLRGCTRQQLYLEVKAGLLTPQVRLSIKRSGWPENEIRTLQAAALEGKNDDEVKAIVKDLVARRKNALEEAGYVAQGTPA